jgi:hypothetical protein
MVVWELLSPEATHLPIFFSESCKQLLQGKYVSPDIGAAAKTVGCNRR